MNAEILGYEIVEKKSRFIGYAVRVADESEAKNFIAEIAKLHKKSRHVAFAYVFSATAETSANARFSDDGEPRGTAGLPLFNAISRRELENVVVVVVRYFGGTLLGKGGLMRSYGKAAGMALDGIL